LVIIRETIAKESARVCEEEIRRAFKAGIQYSSDLEFGHYAVSENEYIKATYNIQSNKK